MDKLLDSASFSDDWQVTLLGAESQGLEKTAAAEEIMKFTKDMETKDDKFYLHINAMGAGEFYGPNRNGDYFPEENLKQWHKTFETSPAHVFRHHVNKDPSIAIGKVIHSYYNDRMHRVELIAEVCKEAGAPELRAIEEGNYPMTSMACNTPYDVCSICNNKARSRSEYCSHLATQLNTTMPDGKRVMSINSGPLKFFDISVVIRPADVTSSVLQKVAGDDICIGSAEAAELENVNYGHDKKASLRKSAVEKIADMMKIIPGEVDSMSDTQSAILGSVADPEDSILPALYAFELEDIIKTFAFLGINPSVEFLVKIIAGKKFGEQEHTIARAAVDALSTYGVESIPVGSETLVPDIEDSEPNRYLTKLLMAHQEHGSYLRDFVEKRASHEGYANWQAGRTKIEPSKFFNGSRTGKHNSLLALAGAAIIVKIMISTMTGMSKVASAGMSAKLMDLAILNELKGNGHE